MGRHIGIKRLRERHAGWQVRDAYRGDILGAIDTGDGMAVHLVDLGCAQRNNAGGIGRLTEHDSDTLGGRRDFEGAHHELDFIGGHDFHGLIDSYASEFPANDDLTPSIMETLETDLIRRQRSEALARRERRRRGPRHVSGKVSGNEDRFTHRRRIIPAGH